MAAALLGEAFLSASVQVLMDNIASKEFLDFFEKKEPNNSLLRNKLKTTLLTLRAVLDDAEDKQITSHAVKEWLDELKDAICDAEDLMDEINTDALRLKVEGEDQNFTNQVWNILSSSNRFHGGMNSKIEVLYQRLDHFAKQKDILGLKEGDRGSVLHRKETGSVIDESAIYGRADDKEELMKLLLDDNANDGKLGVISIVGLGGVGKTSLAQLLYNDEKVKEHFDLRAWACVSEDFDVFAVTKTLLESVTSKTYESTKLNFLQVELMHSLRNKKFLFVLDDLWNEKYNDWDDLRTPFCNGKKGSKVIVTTRQLRVAQMTHTFPIYKVKPLSHEDCWSLFAKHAFENGKEESYPNLEAIGKSIAKKCGGLPIAAKTLGGLLRSRLDEKEWNNVLNSNIWDLPNDDILPALLLSYRYLPAHLKRCFAYCSIFPKDYLFDRRSLVLLWMAEGFIQPFESKKTMERVGEEYFDELMARSFFQQYPGKRKYFVMHDLINDLATVVSGKVCARFEGSEIHKEVRHLSYYRGKYDTSNKFGTLHGDNHLRSFLALPLKEQRTYYERYLTKRVLFDLLPAMRYLRVISLSHYDNITELPSSIGNCIHLRYLELSYTAIKKLPDTICTLYNLQTLLLSNCASLTELPKDIGKLVDLRHLDTWGTNLKEMPIQISRLKNLQTLSTFVVGKLHDGLRISELRNFQQLQGKLSILKLQNVTEVLDASQANLKDKEQIEELELKWDTETNDSRIEREVLGYLQPPTNLKELRIKYYGGTTFPNWLGNSSFSKLETLQISDCDNCYFLPPLGQLPALVKLEIIRMKFVKTVGPEFYGNASSSFQPFRSLRSLRFEEMSDWEEWISPDDVSSGFPSLRFLTLLKCPKLKGHLPSHLSSLIRLQVSDCHQLGTPLSDNVSQGNVSNQVELPLENVPSFSDWMSSLQTLLIINCPGFQGLLETGLLSSCLRQLFIYNVPSLVSFPLDGLPTTLYTLSIRGCEKLELFPLDTKHTYTSLQRIEIVDSCTSLKSFPLSCFPMLKSLWIGGCTNLESLFFSESHPGHLSLLESLVISDCPNLTSFPQVGLRTPNVTEFEVARCKNLKSLPERIDSLTALKELSLCGLHNLVSFFEGGLPSNLRVLQIIDCEKLVPSANWGLHGLTSLREFVIHGHCCAKLMKEQLLPATLLSLRISRIFDLKILDGKQLQNLTSLEKLEISCCRSIECLSEEGLPSSLSVLRITRCPLLSQRCQFKTGKDWSKIAHIPVIQIDDEMII